MTSSYGSLLSGKTFVEPKNIHNRDSFWPQTVVKCPLPQHLAEQSVCLPVRRQLPVSRSEASRSFCSLVEGPKATCPPIVPHGAALVILIGAVNVRILEMAQFYRL